MFPTLIMQADQEQTHSDQVLVVLAERDPMVHKLFLVPLKHVPPRLLETTEVLTIEDEDLIRSWSTTYSMTIHTRVGTSFLTIPTQTTPWKRSAVRVLFVQCPYDSWTLL